MELNQDNALTASESAPKTPSKNAESGAKSRGALANKKSASKSSAKSTPKGAKKPAKMGRPRLSEKERAAKRKQRAQSREVTAIVVAQVEREVDEVKESVAPPSASSPTPLTPSLGVAQRALGIGFGESTDTIPDAQVSLRTHLPENVRRFILIRNACHIAPREIIKEVNEVFGMAVTTSHINHYDPTKSAGATLSDEYKRLFAEMRREYNAVIDRIGAGDQGFRVTTLHNLLIKAVESGASKLAVNILNQVAKEKTAGSYAKPPKETEDKRALLARLAGCDVSNLPPIPKTGASMTAAPRPAKGEAD